MTPIDPDDPMLAKIRKLLAKAEDPAATTEEAEIYTAKAAALAATYGIDQALSAMADPTTDRVGDRLIVLEAPYARDKAGLLACVATSVGCRAVQRTREVDGRNELSLHLFGHAADLHRAEVLFTSLLLQATHGLARTTVPPREHKAAFRRSWLAGFTAAVRRRLDEAERTARQQAEERFAQAGTSTALVLADRGAEVASALSASYPRLGRARARTLTGGGLGEGWNAGQRADLGGARVASSDRAALQ